MSRLISAQLPRGTANWDVPLKEVYLIGIMEFQFNNINSNYLHSIDLMNKDTGKVFYKGMGYKFLELPKFCVDFQMIFHFFIFILKGGYIPACLGRLLGTPSNFQVLEVLPPLSYDYF
ncbi:PD-(D/E)XK nuclease family transposase [Pedobacter heparinus]|uniref:PD-(D/E)XK nuclease family transposase n=1 Tax=Pedobacter heparinus TaxID=984 RepID=UPI00292FCB6F|nr:PD-(D/E)XK nuclease family transposase [Pedobacter heparinus]